MLLLAMFIPRRLLVACSLFLQDLLHCSGAIVVFQPTGLKEGWKCLVHTIPHSVQCHFFVAHTTTKYWRKLNLVDKHLVAPLPTGTLNSLLNFWLYGTFLLQYTLSIGEAGPNSWEDFYGNYTPKMPLCWLSYTCSYTFQSAVS